MEENKKRENQKNEKNNPKLNKDTNPFKLIPQFN